MASQDVGSLPALDRGPQVLHQQEQVEGIGRGGLELGEVLLPLNAVVSRVDSGA